MTGFPSGRCLCGAVRWQAGALPLWQDHCHCDSCRRFTGSGFASFAGFAAGAVVWSGAAPARWTGPTGAARLFCAACGSSLAYVPAGPAGEIHLHAGSYDQPDTFAPGAHDHADARLPWVVLADGLPPRCPPACAGTRPPPPPFWR